jgi:Pyridoxamine 5'-phosphate oxidase
MATWDEFAAAAPELAGKVRSAFDRGVNKLLATLRRDGSPRISGIETTLKDGELWLGMMPQSRKALDLRRDPRMALHSPSEDPGEEPSKWPGDAKLAGQAVEITDPAALKAFRSPDQPPGPFHLFRVELTEVVLTRVGDPPDHLVIELWRDGEGLHRFQRR